MLALLASSLRSRERTRLGRLRPMCHRVLVLDREAVAWVAEPARPGRSPLSRTTSVHGVLLAEGRAPE